MVPTLPLLSVLGGCSITLRNRKVLAIPGARRQLLVATVALSAEVLTQDRLAALTAPLARIQAPAPGSLKTAKSRLEPEIKQLFGKGAEGWTMREVSVDLHHLLEEIAAISTAPTTSSSLTRSRLEAALRAAHETILPDVPHQGQNDTQWLRDRRGELVKARLRLLRVAVEWAGRHDPVWSASLRRTLHELDPESDPPARSLRRPRFRAPEHLISNIASREGPAILGRDSELQSIDDRFSQAAHVHVLYGEGGVGKSALARKYAEDNQHQFRIRWWIDAETDVGLRDGLRELARVLELPSAQASSAVLEEQETAATAFLTELHDCLATPTIGRWLIVLDDVARPESLHTILRYLPSNGSVLITTQRQNWPDIDPRARQVFGIALKEGAEMVAERAGQLKDDEDLRAICQTLECHPMLLLHAADTMRLDGIGAGEYLTLLNDRLEDVVKAWPELGSERYGAAATYALAIDRASSGAHGHPGARTLLEIVAFLAPEPVAEPVLAALAESGIPGLTDRDAVRDARRALVSRSLIQTYQLTQAFSVHRVMQAVVRVEMQRNGSQGKLAFERLGWAVEALGRCVPEYVGSQLDSQRQMAPLASHVDVVAGHVEHLVSGDDTQALRDTTAELCSQLGLYWRTRSEWKAAEVAQQRAVELSAGSLSHAATLRAVRLANAMRQRANFSGAEAVMASALPALRAAVGGDHADLAYALTVQARIFRARPDNAPIQAHEHMEEALGILTRLAGTNYRQLSRTLSYVSVSLRQLGHYAAAEDACREGLRLVTGASPEEELERAPATETDQLVATHLRAIGGLWRLQGRFADARLAHERALSLVIEASGEDHIDAGRCLDSLGRVQREYGDFEDALDSFEKARRISDYRLGPGYPHAGTALINRALTLKEMGRHPDALAAAEEALSIYRKTYGDTYEDGVGALRNEHTASALFVRADLQALIGDIDGAERDHREVLKLRTRKYDTDRHAQVASSLQALGDIAALTEREGEAIALHEQAREIRLEVFSSTDGSYWVAQSDLRLGELHEDPDTARAGIEAAVAVWERQLAPAHPWLLHARALLKDRRNGSASHEKRRRGH
jgi:tetratricopeptide (TPR) repeat protein